MAIISKEFGKDVAALRKAQRMTVQEVANAAGITAEFLEKIESGETDPTVKAVDKLAWSLNVSPCLLTDGNALERYVQIVTEQERLADEKPMIYRLRVDMRQDDAGEWHTVYGMDAYRLVKSIPDIFTDCTEGKSFIELCDRTQPLPEHLNDVVQDAIAR